MDRHTCSIVAVGYIRQIFLNGFSRPIVWSSVQRSGHHPSGFPDQIYRSRKETKVTESRAFCKCPDWYTSDYDYNWLNKGHDIHSDAVETVYLYLHGIG